MSGITPPHDASTTRPRTASIDPFRVLRQHRDFRTFWIGQTLSLVGSWMQTMAVGWLSLQLSDSAFVVGVVASAGAVPVMVLSMHAGAIVDRGDRLRYMRVTQAVFLALAITLWLVTTTGHVTIPWLITIMAVQGIASAIEIPARQAFIIQLVGRQDLQPAIALNSSGFNLARVLGPAVGGLVISRLGIAWCFALNAVSFLAVLWGLTRIHARRTDGAPTVVLPLRTLLATSTQGALDGLRHLARPGPVRELLTLVTIGALFGGPFLTLMPVVARDRLGLGAGGYGSLLATVGVGGLLGALLVAGPLAHRARKGTLLISSAMLFPVLLMVFALTTHLVAAHVLLFAIGVAMIMFNALSNGVLQLLVDEAYRGRLMAFYSLVFIGLSQAVGSFTLGAAAGLFGSAAAIAWSAGILLAAALFGWRRRTFWRLV